ncbi:hypothetical protein MIMGU_mgv1a016129mg [Erythranthe guttata]|uniref:Uncharacterized protein n=1 Tax=Erythranthe guttata TaxID=4155 RepID=A0A022RIA3_ERYGU|nr:hypothetical protein MIMGU_mgv1a016129mg [Erythranthe guttata]
MINAALKSARHPSVFSYSLPNQIITRRKPSGIRFAQSGSSTQPDQMDQKTVPESHTKDTMSSFGEGYATRSDEEGFGGIYGGNQYFGKDKDEKLGNENEGKIVHEDADEFDHSQGSEVKEKEKARNQSNVVTK